MSGLGAEGLRLALDPALPPVLLGAAGAAALALTLYGAWRGQRGQAFRLLAMALLILAALRPTLVVERRSPLNDVAAILVDRSQSQTIGSRPARTEAALAAVKARLAALDHLETRVVEVGASEDDGTRLFDPLSRALADVPNDRLAGVVMITDGQVHDAPADPARAGLTAPVHVLLTGDKGETDRRLILREAPKFAILGETAEISVDVEDPSLAKGARLPVTLSVDGGPAATHSLTIGETARLPVTLSHAGPNVVEIAVPPGPKPLTTENKRAVAVIKGIRDRLRVLLVSGEPHPGERTWRNLLKADPSVDLVHFTILRPPEKQDGTPINELALIAFPTRELFVEKLSQFDLVIFDRHHWRGILPAAYFDNIARYVEAGGSLLVAVGPAYATSLSLFRTPLAAVLPAQPTGEVTDGPFRPRPTEIGRRHPVTADLPGAGALDAEPTWGRWFRVVEAKPLMGETLLAGPGGRPLLQLARVGQGRVAQLLSDQAWLWARGYDGGGPQVELSRRLAHWLMKEPDLEEESLRAQGRGGRIEIIRRSLKPEASPVTVTGPDGATRTAALSLDGQGRWTASLEAPLQGLYRLDDGALQALAVVGPANSREMGAVAATDALLRPVAAATGGGVYWLSEGGTPDFRRVLPDQVAQGAGWAGLRANERSSVLAVTTTPLLPPLALLALLLGGLFLGWWREGR